MKLLCIGQRLVHKKNGGFVVEVVSKQRLEGGYELLVKCNRDGSEFITTRSYLVREFKLATDPKIAMKMGSRFGFLTVEGMSPSKEGEESNSRVDCVCDCGRKISVYAFQLMGRKFKSCGCKRGRPINTAPKYQSRIYWRWLKMGGASKSSDLCDEWKEFAAFERWAIVNGYEDSKRMRRKNPSEKFGPENCEFFSPMKVSIDGQVMSMRKASLKMGKSRDWSRYAVKTGKLKVAT